MGKDDPTLRISIDAKAMDRLAAEQFGEEPPTTPAPFPAARDPFASVDFDMLAEVVGELPAAPVDWILPADFVPVLRVPRADLGWQKLSPLASRILMRVDGASPTADLVHRMDEEAAKVVRELRELVQRGLVGFRA